MFVLACKREKKRTCKGRGKKNRKEKTVVLTFVGRAEPHYGWADVVGDCSQLLTTQPRERPPGVNPNLDFGSGPPQDDTKP